MPKYQNYTLDPSSLWCKTTIVLLKNSYGRRHKERTKSCKYLAISISSACLANGLAEMACQPAHSFYRWRPTGAMFLLVWPHLPTTPHPLLPPLTSVWQSKTCCSRRWYQVRFEFWIQNYFEEVPLLFNLIWIQHLTKSRHKGCHGPQTDPLVQELVSAGLGSTWPCRTRNLFIGLCLCECVFICPYVLVCVQCVCTLTQRGVRLISTMEHSSGVTFSAILHSN